MGKKIPPEDLVIPPQDSRICGTICICQMTAVLSSVALVYLTVAIYMPALRAVNSDMIEVPVMCTTTRAVQRDNCSWVSCGEWCLSKSSGACTQIFVNLRNNGSHLIFYDCSNSANKTCYGINENAKMYRCIADDCRNLTGTFNCTKGTCVNITDAFECMFTETETPLKCSGRRGKITCQSMDGLHDCNRGTCSKIKPPYNCDRRCVDIPTRNKNVILLNRDNVYLSYCLRATTLGDESEEEVYSWKRTNLQTTETTDVTPSDDPMMYVVMASCFEINNTSRGIEAIDCINGSLVPKTSLTELTNFTYLLGLSAHSAVERPLDKTGRVARIESDLILGNESRLQINLEGCVNSLRNECFAFHRDYGKDGTDHNARARFPCFYARNDTSKAIFKFDLQSTYQEFLIAAIVPSVLFVVSCTVLVTCQKSVEVGDDAKMRFKAFPSYPRSHQPTTTRHPRYWLLHTLATVVKLQQQPLSRFYTPAASTPSAGAAGSLGSRLGTLSGSTYERVGEEHSHPPSHPHLADLVEYHINPHHAQPPQPLHPLADTTDETDEDANAEAAQRRQKLNRPRTQAAAMGAVGSDGLPIVSFIEKAKFYTSLCFGTTAILAVFAFLFLIPFIVDPAISSLAADFDPRAVTCVVSSFESAAGLRNCSWSSCREGCTTAALKCTLVRVNYSERYFDDPSPQPQQPLNFTVTDTKFFVNTEGCGYPPRVNCSEFATKYQVMGDKPFPCYRSRTYTDLVVADYSWEKTVRNLVLALAAPPLVFGFTVGVLIFWYCPACSKDKQEENSDGEELQGEDEEY